MERVRYYSYLYTRVKDYNLSEREESEEASEELGICSMCLWYLAGGSGPPGRQDTICGWQGGGGVSMGYLLDISSSNLLKWDEASIFLE